MKIVIFVFIIVMLFSFGIASAGHTPIEETNAKTGEVYNTTVATYPPPSAQNR